MTESDDQGSTNRNTQPRLEIGALTAQLSGFITGPLGMIVGWILTARSNRWGAHEKTLAYALAIPMGVLWLQPFGGSIGLMIQVPTALIAIGIIVYLYRSASRAARESLGSIAPASADDLVRLRPRSSPGPVNAIRTVVGWSLTAAAGFGAWWVWMGWDGDDFYMTWQVIGSAVTVVVVVLAAWWWLPRAVTISAVTIGYAVGWGASSMPGDESGLSGVGLIMVVIGVCAASALIVVLADAGEIAVRRPKLNKSR